jgi:hypothetical protein
MSDDACTLPTTERPLRFAEWNALFATARVKERPAPTRLRLELVAPEAAVRDLAARESACCSFFDFGVVAAPGWVELTITVPPAYAGVLDVLG